MLSILKNNLSKLRTVSTYTVVGIGTTIGFFLLYIAFIEFDYMKPFWAAVFGYIPGIFISFFLCYFWVFRSSSNIYSTSVKFFTVNILGYIINFIGIYIFVDLLLISYLVSQLIAFVIVALHNYLLNYYWTFSNS